MKDIFEEAPYRFSKLLSPTPIKELLPTNLPSTELRLDFLAKLEDESILHMEFQSFNDPTMPCRRNIRQLLVYVGNKTKTQKPNL
ncbi:hypothetical protein IAE16_04555 [Hydrogenobacter sp. T-2]|uniref:hypothetical protein n=1 Tax=Pampinifervens diazotrophicum TaxID=1632018 RepID=UPI002B25DE83|nr:hypothetical protein [Hydrogenobacter sp. T-2]WPM32955.1 hypothetical protein IAE16_04555 [Hydrogenobacter sp. T-2]